MNIAPLANRSCAFVILIGILGVGIARGQTAPSGEFRASAATIDKIREEGLNHSQAMQTLSYLTDVIGPRLTGSPNLKHANEWTRDTLSKWGLENAHLEPWGLFGRGWSLKRFSVQIVEPQTIILIAYPKAWTPGFDEPFTAPVIWIDAKTESDLKKYEGKLKGAVVLAGGVRPVEARFDPLAARVSDSDLLGLADATPGTTSPPGQARAANVSERSAQFADTAVGQRLLRGRGGATTQPAGGRLGRRGGRGGAGLFTGRILTFAAKEGAALVIDASLQGDGGTVFVAGASVPGQTGFGRGGPRVYSVDCPPIPAQATMAVEDYNRLVRMIQQGEQLKMSVDLQVQYHTDDLMAYNTIAEIPGADPERKDQIVMIGGHMDSWQAGTGATDNGVGVVAAMEAVRILEACNLRPRRTIRIALWTGEEQGLLGSRAYVSKHFGSYPGQSAFGGGGRGRRGRAAADESDVASSQPATTRPSRGLEKGPEYEQLCIYFNLDNGTGKIRGVYMQNDEAAHPYFRAWLAPFADLGATTLTPSNTGSTDHISFDNIGLPGFQFIQDPIEYFSRSHHSSADVFDRIQADDLKQAATIMAAFLYDAAQMDERFPRKPLR
ncbi:MAG TPA: M20/M25/M40 family metallo-hydrolase [Tepidisphaeraceae bacterium]|nr:M20/M25/M40 family metallo-hydrolase [Tepidisphaeraceae bacterium]